MTHLKKTLLCATVLAAAATAARAEPKVVASIKPIHSLVAAVMQGVGEPELIVDGAGSPHTYALKPSQAATLEEADLVFWIGHELEAFLEKPVETIAAKATSVELIDAHDLVRLSFREGGPFEKHDHGDDDHHDDHAHAEEAGHDDHKHDHDDDHKHAEDDHDHDDHAHAEKAGHDHDHDHKHEHEEKAEADHDHDDHGHEHAEAGHDDHGHEHEKSAKAGHDDHGHDDHGHDHAEAGHDGHAHGEFDSHVWLDPHNAKAMIHEIEEALAKVDPANAEKYEANAEAAMAKLDALTTEITTKLEPVKGNGFIVFHDAYQYFENRFGVAAAGSITVSPEVIPGAERVANIKAKVAELGATCVFSEPQFEPKLVTTVTEGTNAKSGVLDPLGAALEDGPDLYFDLIRNLATSMHDCLGGSS